jgi:hypothetical protein
MNVKRLSSWGFSVLVRHLQFLGSASVANKDQVRQAIEEKPKFHCSAGFPHLSPVDEVLGECRAIEFGPTQWRQPMSFFHTSTRKDVAIMSSKSQPTKPEPSGMQGEDFNYSGAGSASEAKKPAVVSGEVKKISAAPFGQTPIKGTAEETKWGNRVEGEQVPGGVKEVENAGDRNQNQS